MVGEGKVYPPMDQNKEGVDEARFLVGPDRLISLGSDRKTLLIRQVPDLVEVTRMRFDLPGYISFWDVDEEGSTVVFVVDEPGDWNDPGLKRVFLWQPHESAEATLLDQFEGLVVDLAVDPLGKWIFLARLQQEAKLYRRGMTWEPVQVEEWRDYWGVRFP